MATVNSYGGKLFDIYYTEASKYPLLSIKEEKELFVKFHKWKNNKAGCGSYTRKKAFESRDTLINSNLRLVIKIAKDYMGNGLDMADLINEGNVGLIKAVDKFKLGKGAKLSHYAGFWIRQSIIRGLANHGRTIRLPSGAVQQKLNILKFVDEFEEKNNRPPNVEEVAKGLKLTADRVILLNDSSLNVISLNSHVSRDEEDGNKELGDLVSDQLTKDPSALTEIQNNREVLNKCLNRLTEREKYIIARRYGLDVDKPETLEVIGKKFGVTRERIRQVEIIAMRKLTRYIRQEMKQNS